MCYSENVRKKKNISLRTLIEDMLDHRKSCGETLIDVIISEAISASK